VDAAVSAGRNLCSTAANAMDAHSLLRRGFRLVLGPLSSNAHARSLAGSLFSRACSRLARRLLRPPTVKVPVPGAYTRAHVLPAPLWARYGEPLRSTSVDAAIGRACTGPVGRYRTATSLDARAPAPQSDPMAGNTTRARLREHGADRLPLSGFETSAWLSPSHATAGRSTVRQPHRGAWAVAGSGVCGLVGGTPRKPARARPEPLLVARSEIPCSGAVIARLRRA
jgi:hypothetical protein